MISLLLAGGFIALSTMEASAVLCARGVYRAGCVGAGGAVVVGRPAVHPASSRHGGPSSFAAGCTDNPATHPPKHAASAMRGGRYSQNSGETIQ
jgi:hypothetical protein